LVFLSLNKLLITAKIQNQLNSAMMDSKFEEQGLLCQIIQNQKKNKLNLKNSLKKRKK